MNLCTSEVNGMNDTEKIAKIKALLNIDGTDEDSRLAVYLSLARDELLAWLYNGKTPEGITDVPERYETVQIMAVVYGYGQAGAEGQTAYAENGISRTWKYDSMVAFIRDHVFPYIEVL